MALDGWNRSTEHGARKGEYPVPVIPELLHFLFTLPLYSPPEL